MTTALAFVFVIGLSPAEAGVEQGTQLILRIEALLTTRTAREGDPVDLRTAHPIVLNGRAIPSGSEARAVVIRSQRPGHPRARGARHRSHVNYGARWHRDPAQRLLVFVSDATAAIPAHVHSPATLTPFAAGMAAGYGTAALVSKVTDSADAMGKSAVVAGVATGVLVGVMKRGEELILQPGRTIDVLIR